jgi:hypothetical protein
VVEGDITVVEPGEDEGTGVVVVEDGETGEPVGVEVTEDTDVIVDGQPGDIGDLDEDQQAEVTVGEDGVTADSVVVTTNTPPAVKSLSGVVVAVDPVRRVIVIVPPQGEQLRLTVDMGAVITNTGAVVRLNDVEPGNLVLATSKYLPESGIVTRLALAYPGNPSNNGQQSGNGNQGGNVAAPFTIRGVLRSMEGNSWVFDGMALPKDSGLTLPDGVSEGSQVDLVFTIAPDGSVVLTGLQAAH